MECCSVLWSCVEGCAVFCGVVLRVAEFCSAFFKAGKHGGKRSVMLYLKEGE